MAKAKKKKAKKVTRKKSTKTKKASPKKKKTTKKASKKKAASKKAVKKKVAGKKKTAKKAKKKAAKKTTKKAAKKKKATRKAAKKSTKKTAKKASKKKTSKKKAAKKKTAKKKNVRAGKKTKKAAKKTTKKAAKKTTRKKATSKKATKKSSSPKKTTASVSGGAKSAVPKLALESYEVSIKPQTGVIDQSAGSTTYAWIGAGQCGGRLVKAFYDMGYKKALAVNTTHHDLDLLDLPKNQKLLLDVGEQGAGKDMGRGQQAVRQYNQEILHNIQKTFGTDIDRIMVSFGAGGGSGGGGVKELIDIAKNHARYSGIENPEKKVGAVMTLPTVGEAGSPSVRANAGKVAMELAQMARKGEISPLIVIDNEKISRMYPNMTVKEFWPTINTTVAQLFDIFNRLSALSSPYTSFDPVDYQSIMEVGGCMIMGLTKVENYRDKFALSAAVKENLEKTLLAGGFDLATAKLAGAIVVGGKSMMANTPGLQENIDYAFDVLAGVTGQATLHRGIYEDNRETLRVYTIIGGLDAPANRFADFK